MKTRINNSSQKIILHTKSILSWFINSTWDSLLYLKHSSVLSQNTQCKVEGKLIYYYHSIEKGLINDPIRYRFGVPKIKKLISLLYTWVERGYDPGNSQFIAACSVLGKYYQLHQDNKIEIRDIITESDYILFKKHYIDDAGGIVEYFADDYFNASGADYSLFSYSRRSVRHFAGKTIPVSEIHDVVRIARNAPSVCNRQSIGLKFIDSKVISNKILSLQSGMNSTAGSVNQLFVIVSDRNYFVASVERNQCYIDGGIFLMNLLYALHYKKIAACPLHCSLDISTERKIKKILGLKASEKLIALVPVGYPPDSFKVPVSKRKEVEEILRIIG